MTAITMIWGHSSAGRAPAWHAGGQRFESAWLHQVNSLLCQLVWLINHNKAIGFLWVNNV